MDRELERALTGGWPDGYEPGKGFPGTITADKLKPPPRCDKILCDSTLVT